MRVGLDIGGTKTHAVVIDQDGRPLQQLRLPTGFGSDAMLVTAMEALRRVATLAGVSTGDFESIGVGIPGTVDTASGRVSFAISCTHAWRRRCDVCEATGMVAAGTPTTLLRLPNVPASPKILSRFVVRSKRFATASIKRM